MNEQERRQALADFLRTRRERLSPIQSGYPVGRRRTPGLRREEVAQEAGVSTTWYTWLEQGRAIHVSTQVVESLARVLQLAADERAYLFQLTVQPPATDTSEHQETVSPALQHVLRQLTTTAAYFRGQRWDILAWNRAACAVMGQLCAVPVLERNTLYRFFCNPATKQLYDDWEYIARCMLAQFRANAGVRISDPWFKELLDLLKQRSPEFRQWWPRHEILGMPEGRKDINHPLVGRLAIEHTTFQVATAPHLQLVLNIPFDEETEQKMQRLLAPGCPHHCQVSEAVDK